MSESNQKNTLENHDFETEPLTERNKQQDENIPEDKGNAMYFVFLLYGFGILLPFNAVTTAFDFFIEKMPGFLPASTYPFACNGLLGITQVVLLIYGKNISNTTRLVPGFFVQGIIMIILPMLANQGGDFGFWSCFWVLIFTGIFMGACQGTVFQMAAAFPFKYMGAVMVGNGMAGIGSNFFRAITLLVFPSDGGENNEFYGALSIFIFSSVVMFLCGLTQLYVRKNEYARYYLVTKGGQDKDQRINAGVKEDGLNTTGNSSPSAISLGNGLPQAELRATQTSINEENGDQKQSLGTFMVQAKRNFTATEGLLLALAYVFILTFICFPGLSDDTHFTFLSNVKNQANWYNLICLIIFNGWDLTGRYIGGSPCADVHRRSVVIMALVRTIFAATFLCIAFEVSPTWLFQADWFKLMNFSIFAFTNGYTSTLCAVKAPATVEGEQKGQVGAFIGVTISLGILIGSLAALGMGPIIALTPAAKAAANA